MPSKRIQSIDVSGVRKMFDLAKKCKNPCNLSIGQPDFDTPQPIKDAAIAAIQGGKNGYTQTQGIDPLLEAVKERYRKKGAPQEAVIATPAISAGFVLALMATCDVGDEMIIPDPYFVIWKDILRVNGVTPVLCDTYPREPLKNSEGSDCVPSEGPVRSGHEAHTWGSRAECSSRTGPSEGTQDESRRIFQGLPSFRWDRQKLEACISPKTKAIVLASPGNPTGVAATEDELKMIAEVAKKHDLWVIYDEIYELFIFDKPHLNMSNYYEKTITLAGFSKGYGMAGWRLGTAAGPKGIIEQMLKLQQFTTICASSISQWAGLKALEVNMDAQVQDYKRKRDYVIDRLKDHYEFVIPDGSFYIFVKVPTDETADEFVARALKEELILSSGSAFSSKNTHFRLSFGAKDKDLERGTEILLTMAPQLAEVV